MVKSLNNSAVESTSGATAAEIPLDMASNRQYRLVARGADMWFRIVTKGATGAAAAQVATNGSHFLPNGQAIEVAAMVGATPGALRARVSIIRDASTDVTGILSELATVAITPIT